MANTWHICCVECIMPPALFTFVCPDYNVSLLLLPLFIVQDNFSVRWICTQ